MNTPILIGVANRGRDWFRDLEIDERWNDRRLTLPKCVVRVSRSDRDRRERNNEDAQKRELVAEERENVQ